MGQESQLKLMNASKQIEDEKFNKIEIDPCTRRAPNFNLENVEMENLSFIESKSENNEEKETQDDSSLDMTAASFSAFDMELDEEEKENEEDEEEDNYPDYIDTCSRIQHLILTKRKIFQRSNACHMKKLPALLFRKEKEKNE